jgi:asparagine synthase (glutamine-hydrolysing)
MCGIAGIANLDGSPVPDPVIRRMADSMAHRGPDDLGIFHDGPVAFGHRRLSIIDLSPTGHQPMTSEDGSIVVTYNGEIYNFLEIRQELEAKGHWFRSRSDTEVVVHAWEEWGEAALARFNGMFAFGVLDRAKRRLTLARDRYGIKPLYWYLRDGAFIFGSEVKSILQAPGVSRDVNPSALNEYFTFQNIFSSNTMFGSIRVLMPGTALRLELEPGAQPDIATYWDFTFPAEPLAISEQEAAEHLRTLFTKAVTRQLVSDVPVGSYLSGGMDSGSITAVASQSLGRLRTFTCGFDINAVSGLEVYFDERERAEGVANALRTEHYEVVLHAGDMEEVMPELIWHLEDLRVGQCYPNYYVSRLASKFVKVVLSGIGGDELFAGYPWRYYRGLAAGAGDDYARGYYDFWQRLVPDADKPALFAGDVLRSIGDETAYDRFREVFGRQTVRTGDPESQVTASLYFELKTFLHGLLIVEDKISMAHSLETRVPFLDNDFVDFALQVPTRLKLRNLESIPAIDENLAGKRHLYQQRNADGKAVLRTAMANIIPGQIETRSKQGFSAPDASWFRGASIDYLNRLLRDRRAMIYEFVSPAYVSRILDEHCAGQVNHRLLIWSLLSFEWWCRTFLGQAGGRLGPPEAGWLPPSSRG